MLDEDREKLRAIKTFPSLVRYLRDELNWPIETDDFDEIVFDYEPEELGIDPETAVKVDEIKQLRPLITNQPWGIFFIKFEPKRLSVVVLRRILSRLVFKKRASANKSEQASWSLDDLLFISNYGEDEQRQITFAHFSQDKERGDLPTLKVLGWDDADTALHLDHCHQELKGKLHWPDDEHNLKDWREKWSSVFILRHREVITTSKDLAMRLADLARRIRHRANRVLAFETEQGHLRKLYKSFQEALIHDLSEDDFADMYAQTIAYGLLAARVSRPMGVTADSVADMIPITNPFLKDMLGTFLTAGGRKGAIDFDELGVQEVVELLNNPDTHMDAILRDFGNRTQQEDPVIHFYELFLSEYDKKKKVQRGIFYTPQPVVSYIVRGVHELLQNEFGLEDGLAAITTWGEMVKRKPDIKIPGGVSPDEPFVQILDPAIGTATFVVEVIDIIHQTMRAKWIKQGHMALETQSLWNEYVPKHLLPRLYGFELMMAPYAIAHMKLGLKLYETGYTFNADERVHVYLTNSLEPATDSLPKRVFEQWAPALAHEAIVVNEVKRNKRFTVIIGNPPYSNYGQLNKIPFILELLEDYKSGLNEKKINIDDDYIKFVKLAQYSISQTGTGVWGFITNNSFFDGLTHRVMRKSLLRTFNQIRVFDLHGNLLAQEKTSDGLRDENVFDIQQGVGITIGKCGLSRYNGAANIMHASLLGTRDYKYSALLNLSLVSQKFNDLAVTDTDYLFFTPKIRSGTEEYDDYLSIRDIFNVVSYGIQTKQDALFISFDRNILAQRLREVIEDVNKLGITLASDKHELGDSSGWSAKRLLGLQFDETKIRKVYYRPFDLRWIYYDRDALGRARYETMKHMLWKNIALVSMRQVFQDVEEYSHMGIAQTLIDERTFYSNRGGTYLFPFYVYAGEDSLWSAGKSSSKRTGIPNFSEAFIKRLQNSLDIEIQTVKNGFEASSTVHLIADYMYAVFLSPIFRTRYKDKLKIDFPRLPLTSNLELFHLLSQLGEEMVALHLMESPKLNTPITQWRGSTPSKEVEKVTYSDETVWIDKGQTEGFQAVPENVWNFHIGGYQVTQKWLKDRKGRRLTYDELNHYQKIVVVLRETVRLMKEIDEVIEGHGGWPGAFK